MLELVNIKRYYTQKKGPTVKALDDVSLVFPETGMVFVLGKSGSGKSTLLNVIGGLDQATSGDLIIKGKSTKKFKQNEFDSYRNTMVGFIFQEYNVLNDFTVGQNIGIALELQGEKASNEKINAMLELLDMQGYGHRKPNTLSGGQKQRVAIARALVKNPQIIMADEPTGALDSVTGKQLFETLKKLSQDKLVIVVTHDHEFAENYGDRIIEFSDGKVIRDVSKVKNEKQETNTVFSEEGITVSAGYELTAEDLVKINEYLRQNRDKTFIKVLNNDYEFKPTKQPASFPKTEKLDLIKSKMPFKSALKIGASALKHKRFRLALSIILATSAFAMFGLTDAIANFKRTETTINTMLDLNIGYSSISKIERIKYSDYYYSQQVGLDDDDLAELEKIDNRLDFFPVLNEALEYSSNFYSDSFDYYDPYRYGINTIAHLKDADLTKANLSLLAGTLPTNKNEVAVPEYVFDSFKKYGYRSLTNSTKIAIDDPEDLLNKTLNNKFVISGVYKTGLEVDRFIIENVDDDGSIYNTINTEVFRQYLLNGFHTTLLVHEEYYDKLVEQNKVYSLPFNSNSYFQMGDVDRYQFTTRNFRRIESLKTNNDVILFNGITHDNLGRDDIILSTSAAFFQGMEGGVHDSVQTALLVFVDNIKSTDENDLAIEQMLKTNYQHYGFNSPLDVTAPSLWSEQEKTSFRNFYAQALLTFLYDENPFQPELIGREAIFAVTSAQIKTDFAPFNIEYFLVAYESDGEKLKAAQDLRVVGFTFDYQYYIEAWDSIIIYINEENAEVMNLTPEGAYFRAVTYHGNSRAIIQKLVKFNELGTKKDVGSFYRMNNEVSYLVENVGDFLEIISRIFVVVGIIFAVFASLLFLNFITLSVAFKKQEIGILRAIGARGIDVATIFMNEAGIIALINLILSFMLAIIAGTTINNYIGKNINIYLSIVNVGLRQLLLLILIAFGVAFISSFIPVFRLSRKKPIDAIRMR